MLMNAGRRLVAFSSGTYGAALADGSEYDGSFAEKCTVEQLMDFHLRRLQAITLLNSQSCAVMVHKS